jgi:CRISPR-associated protein Cas2
MSPEDKRVSETLKKLKDRLEQDELETVAPALRHRRQWVVVSYDIVDDKRRNKVMKTLEGFGHRVQYSVFECELRPADLEKLKARLRGLIVPQEDDIRFYQLCENCLGKVTMLGRAKMYREKAYEIITGRQGNK